MDFGDESKREWDSRLWVSNQKGNGSNHASLWTTTMGRLGCRIRYIQVQHSETALVIMVSAAVKHRKIPAASSCFINYALQNIRSGYNHTLFFPHTHDSCVCCHTGQKHSSYLGLAFHCSVCAPQLIYRVASKPNSPIALSRRPNLRTPALASAPSRLFPSPAARVLGTHSAGRAAETVSLLSVLLPSSLEHANLGKVLPSPCILETCKPERQRA